MFNAYAEGSALECVAMKTAMTMPALLLQKPSYKSKAKEHALHLQRRLKLWLEGKLDDLMHEGRTIQRQLIRSKQSQRNNDERNARLFAKLMMEGKVRAAIRLVTQASGNGPLSLNNLANPEDPTTTQTVRDVLIEKHPPKKPPKESAIIKPDTTSDEPHPVLFEELDGQMIRSTVLRMEGVAGPSGLDAASWKRLRTSFKGASTDLCESLAATARRICTCFVDPRGLSAFVACRLVALDKCPGVRPIGIGETARRLIGRAIARLLRDDIQTAAGPLQLCAGYQSGCEAAVHAMRQVFESPSTEAVLLVDATNAFNVLNRQVALRNIRHLCPPLSKILINTYREDVRLFIDGETLLSQRTCNGNKAPAASAAECCSASAAECCSECCSFLHFVCCGMPVVCCRCNASGRCKNCSCRKAGKECVNCLPSRRARCDNPSSQESCIHSLITADTENECVAKEIDDGNEIRSSMDLHDMNMADQTMATAILETQPETRLNIEQNVEELPPFLHQSQSLSFDGEKLRMVDALPVL